MWSHLVPCKPIGSGSVRSVINLPPGSESGSGLSLYYLPKIQRNFRFSSNFHQIMIYYTTHLISYFSLWPQNVQVGFMIIWIPGSGSERNIYGYETPVPRKKYCSLRYIMQVESKGKVIRHRKNQKIIPI